MLLINGKVVNERMTDFKVICNKCGSEHVTVDIDYSVSRDNTFIDMNLVCSNCNNANELLSDSMD